MFIHKYKVHCASYGSHIMELTSPSATVDTSEVIKNFREDGGFGKGIVTLEHLGTSLKLIPDVQAKADAQLAKFRVEQAEKKVATAHAALETATAKLDSRTREYKRAQEEAAEMIEEIKEAAREADNNIDQALIDAERDIATAQAAVRAAEATLRAAETARARLYDARAAIPVDAKKRTGEVMGPVEELKESVERKRAKKDECKKKFMDAKENLEKCKEKMLVNQAMHEISSGVSDEVAEREAAEQKAAEAIKAAEQKAAEAIKAAEQNAAEAIKARDDILASTKAAEDTLGQIQKQAIAAVMNGLSRPATTQEH